MNTKSAVVIVAFMGNVGADYIVIIHMVTKKDTVIAEVSCAILLFFLVVSSNALKLMYE